MEVVWLLHNRFFIKGQFENKNQMKGNLQKPNLFPDSSYISLMFSIVC